MSHQSTTGMGCGFTGQEKGVRQHGEHHVGGRACLSCYLTLPSHVIPMPWLLLHSQGLGDEADRIEQFSENVCFFPSCHPLHSCCVRWGVWWSVVMGRMDSSSPGEEECCQQKGKWHHPLTQEVKLHGKCDIKCTNLTWKAPYICSLWVHVKVG